MIRRFATSLTRRRLQIPLYSLEHAFSGTAWSKETTPSLPEKRVAEVAVVGLPNAGKSSLLNSLLSRKVAAVSSKRNTTRRNLLAVASDVSAGVQISFFDTPGFVAYNDEQTQDHGRSNRDKSQQEKGRRGRGGRVERSVLVDARNAVKQDDVTCALVVVDVAKSMTPDYVNSLKSFMGDLALTLARREVHKQAAEAEAAGEAAAAAAAAVTTAPFVRRRRTTSERKTESKGCVVTSLAARVAAIMCLVLNKVDLVNPKHLLLPSAAGVHQALAESVAAAAAKAVREAEERRRRQHKALAAQEVKENETNRGVGGRRVERAGGGGGGGGGGLTDKVEDRVEAIGEAKDEVFAQTVAGTLGVEVFLVSATADQLEDAHTSGVAELRKHLYKGAIVRPWDQGEGDDNDDEGDEEEEDGGYEEEEEEDEEAEGNTNLEVEGEEDEDDDDDDDAWAAFVDKVNRRGGMVEEEEVGGKGSSAVGEPQSTPRRRAGKSREARPSSSSPSVFSSMSSPSPGGFDRVTSELDDKEWAEECVREQVFRFLHKELPYRVNQENRLWRRERRRATDGSSTLVDTLVVHQDLVVGTRSHKKMAIGPKGETLRRMQDAAEAEMCAHFKPLKVELRLWVTQGSKGSIGRR